MRPFTLAEEEEIKRQRKLIKNREYAQTSRIKKRETLSSLQVQLTAVNTENQILKSHITNLTQQVQYLQIENHQLRMMFSSYSVAPPGLSPETVSTQAQSLTPLAPPAVSSSPSYSEVYPSSPSLSTEENDLLGVISTSDSDDTCLPMEAPFPNQSDPFGEIDSGTNWVTDNYTAGLCLLVILFSFGLFFNGILFEGISVMVGPVVGTSSTTSRMLFGFIGEEPYELPRDMDSGGYNNTVITENLEELRENIPRFPEKIKSISGENWYIPGLCNFPFDGIWY
jgi:hypothetical protein